MKKIAFYGGACAGKTYCANIVQNLVPGIERVSFASPLKSVASMLFGVDGKDGNGRIILQQIGEKMREIDPDVWIKFLLNREVGYLIEDDLERDDPDKYPWVDAYFDADTPRLAGFVLDDLRYINEAKALKEDGWILVLVDTPAIVRMERYVALYPNSPEGTLTHDSEQEWKQITPDYIVNSTDENVHQSIRNFLGEIN